MTKEPTTPTPLTSEPTSANRRDTPVRDFGLAFRRFFMAVFAQRCPNCGKGHTGKNFFLLKPACEVCGARFEWGDSGSWLVGATLNYFFTAIICIVASIFLVRSYGFFPGFTWAIVGLALAVGILLYRPAKTVGLWLLWLFGFIYPK